VHEEGSNIRTALIALVSPIHNATQNLNISTHPRLRPHHVLAISGGGGMVIALDGRESHAVSVLFLPLGSRLVGKRLAVKSLSEYLQ
jgi:hypothetical protein